MMAVRKRRPDPLEQAGHPGALVVVPRLPRAGADAAANDQHIGALACHMKNYASDGCLDGVRRQLGRPPCELVTRVEREAGGCPSTRLSRLTMLPCSAAVPLLPFSLLESARASGGLGQSGRSNLQ